ncbi:hypothetical protein BBP40_011940 [Aspergillus hancockii]|nr:hypothetical protein BBP40_011940 [Aspergillus hancockii]
MSRVPLLSGPEVQPVPKALSIVVNGSCFMVADNDETVVSDCVPVGGVLQKPSLLLSLKWVVLLQGKANLLKPHEKDAVELLILNSAIDPNIWSPLESLALPIIIITALCTFRLMGIAWKLYNEFAWDTFRKVAAVLEMRRKYLHFQLLVSLLKFDRFFSLGFPVQISVIKGVRRGMEGCSTCRRRKVKCGEERPVCKRCSNLRLSCEWGVPVRRGKSGTPARHLQPRWSGRDIPVAAPTSATTEIDYPQYATPAAASWYPIGAMPDLTGFSFGSIPSPGWSGVSPYPPPPPLYSSLSGTDFACANSLVLSDHDQKYFQYFPSSSVVFYYMKSWQWSSFCYLYQGPAVTNKVIMRMILALSASDMHRNGLMVRSPGRPTAEDHGRYHYGLAVKEFRQSLVSPRSVSPAELETILATMFLMITYEWQYGHCVRHLQLHLQGVKSLLASHPELFQIKDVNNVLLSMEAETPDESESRVSFIPEQLLLWILYIDASCQPMGLTESLYDYVLQSGNPALHPDRLYRCARVWGRCFWGKQYPDQQVSDDMENYRALELLHVGMSLRFRTWQLLVDNVPESSHQTESLFDEIMATTDKYSDMFITAKFAGPASMRRTLNTINMAVSVFYGQVILHRRLLCPSQPPRTVHRHALTNILEIAHKQYASEPRLVRRLHWPLLMAVIETEDPVQREWIRQRLLELCEFHSEYRWANDVVDEVLARQDASKGEYVNLAELMRSRSLPK